MTSRKRQGARRTSSWVVLLLAMLTMLVAAACGGDDEETASSAVSAAVEAGTSAAAEATETTAATTETTETATDTGGAAAGGAEGKKIAVLLFSRGFEFMVALDQAAQQAAKDAGAEVVVLDGKGDTATQIQQIEDQIAAGVDGFVISPNNSEEIVPGVERANEAGIPVVTIDAIAAGGKVESYVGFDNKAGGAEAAKAVAELIGDEGKVLELTGAQGAFHAVRRGGGFNEEMKANHPNIEVITRDAEWQADKALSLTVDNLTSNPDIKAIFTHNDEMVRGVISGLQQVGKTDVVIVGVDGTPLALERIRNGEQAATINQSPFDMGRLGVEDLVKVFNGEEVEAETLLPPTKVTKENADDAELWGNVFKG